MRFFVQRMLRWHPVLVAGGRQGRRRGRIAADATGGAGGAGRSPGWTRGWNRGRPPWAARHSFFRVRMPRDARSLRAAAAWGGAAPALIIVVGGLTRRVRGGGRAQRPQAARCAWKNYESCIGAEEAKNTAAGGRTAAGRTNRDSTGGLSGRGGRLGGHRGREEEPTAARRRRRHGWTASDPGRTLPRRVIGRRAPEDGATRGRALVVQEVHPGRARRA